MQTHFKKFTFIRSFDAFFFEKVCKIKILYLYLQRYRGEIPNRRCISLLFRTYRKDVGNLFWNSLIAMSKGMLRKTYSPTTAISYATRPLAWSILICCEGFQISYVCPLGKCIRMATPFLYVLPLALPVKFR